MTQEMTTLTTILSLILSLASAWLSMGFISISLRLFDEKAVSFSDGIIDLKTTFKTFVAKVITTIFTLVGFIFLIVPGIIIQTRLFFVTTLILDKDLGIWEAITTSREMTK